jgi:transcription elongation factor Elf1
MNLLFDNMPCPNCGAQLVEWSVTKNDHSTEGEFCRECGLDASLSITFMPLRQLNYYRTQANPPLPPLTELPERKLNFIHDA